MNDLTEDVSTIENVDDLDIRHFKLVSGDEIISIVVDFVDGYIVMANPLKIVFSPRADGNIMSTFMRWNLFSSNDEPCYVNESNVIFHAECERATMMRYIEVILRDIDSDDGESEQENDMGSDDIEDYDSEDMVMQMGIKKRVLH